MEAIAAFKAGLFYPAMVAAGILELLTKSSGPVRKRLGDDVELLLAVMELVLAGPAFATAMNPTEGGDLIAAHIRICSNVLVAAVGDHGKPFREHVRASMRASPSGSRETRLIHEYLRMCLGYPAAAEDDPMFRHGRLNFESAVGVCSLLLGIVNQDRLAAMTVPDGSGRSVRDFLRQRQRTAAERSETEDTCDRCGAAGKLKRCSRCGLARHCGSACQKADWAEHRRTCNSRAAN
ncbi:hypothetical protein DFJ74DRAFT_403220 [Hyaloraphidium curvatum]|nr:hypothetical protein DFJ74DRAFT_403220 [Hyaloraphidium curvatum]